MTRFPLLVLCLLSPLAVAQPAAKPPPKTPWANKLFLPDLGNDPDRLAFLGVLGGANEGLLPDSLSKRSREAPAFVAHDFGPVPAGTVCSHTFTLTNIYTVPMQVVDVRVECGCLKAFPPNKVLQPNEAAEFTVTMNAAQFKGRVTKKMLVTVGPSYVSTAELRFTAECREDVSVTAPGLIDFGIIPQGKATERAVTLKYTGGRKDWKVEPLNAPAGIYTVDVAESSRGQVLGAAYTVTVGLKDTAPPGPLSDTLVLKTNDPDTPTVTVAIAGRVQPPVKVAGEGVVVFELDKLTPGAEATGKVLVLADARCKLTAPAEVGDGLSVDIFPVNNDRHVVTVRYVVPKGAAPLRKEIRLGTDLPGQPQVAFFVEVR